MQKNISVAVFQREFSLPMRLKAAINLTDQFQKLHNQFQDRLSRLTAEDVYVDSETGDVRVEVTNCLDSSLYDLPSHKSDYLRYINNDGQSPIQEKDIVQFVVYSTFRLLCIDNPYDGKKTLVEYPYLSQHNIDKIHAEKNVMMSEDMGNQSSECIGRIGEARWTKFPVFFRKAIKEALQGSKNNLTLEEWMEYLCRLRDCLALVKEKTVFFDPQTTNKVLFMCVGKYHIPVLNQKKIYTYHIGMKSESMEEEVIAIVDSRGELQNLSEVQWVIECEDGIAIIQPRETFKPSPGMKIKIGDQFISVIHGGSFASVK